jgi:hypothetical protein
LPCFSLYESDSPRQSVNVPIPARGELILRYRGNEEIWKVYSDRGYIFSHFSNCICLGFHLLKIQIQCCKVNHSPGIIEEGQGKSLNMYHIEIFVKQKLLVLMRSTFHLI